MSAPFLFVVIAGIFGVLPILWKSKGAYVFLLLCAGSILSASVSGNVANEIRDAVNTNGMPVQSIVQGIILLLPAFLAILITRKSVKSKKMAYHLFPSLAAGILAYLWFIRVLPYEQFSALESAALTKDLLQVRDIALISGILSVLALLVVERPKPDPKKHGKH
jgi:hypothetical protein